MSAVTWVAIGLLGGLGALARFQVGAAVNARASGAFPAGTLVVNLSGGFLLGLLVGLGVSESTLVVLGGGLLGGYTTFSTWMVESERLAAAGRTGLAWLNLVGSTLAGLLAAGFGLLAGAALS